MQYDLIDIDIEIEKKAQMCCRDIYITQGKDFFRKLEKRIIQTLPRKKTVVIASGGSAYLDEDNQKIFKEIGICVALYKPKKQQYALWKQFPTHLQEESFKKWYQRRYQCLCKIADVWLPAGGDNYGI